MIRIEHDVTTNKIVEISLSNEEIKLKEIEQSELNKKAAARIAELAEKDAARKAIFDKLGITEEEAKLLLS